MAITPKQAGFKMPPEWVKHAACWMAWPCHQQTWVKIGLQQARETFAAVAKAIAKYEPVKMLVNPEDAPGAASLCGKDIELITLAINDSWTRDTGATFLLNNSNELAGVDWLHNAWGGNYSDYTLDAKIAQTIIAQTKARYFHAPLVMEGGAFHVDGEGSILTTRECLLHENRNPLLSQVEIENYLCDYLNGEKVIWLDRGLVGDETNGHIDEIACFIAPGKILALITSDPSDENFTILQENLKILQNSTDAKGRYLEIYTVEQPPATYLQGERLTLSYINFYCANEGIIMPAFGHIDYDQQAYELFVKIFPNHHITQLNAVAIFAGGGGIHCITQQQPQHL